MPLHVVTVVGMSIVFLIFVILYATFRTMGYLFEVNRRRKRREETRVTERKVEETEEIVAAISAVLSQVLKERYRIVSIRPVENRGYTVWRRTGWKGVRKWQGSSRLS